jgi:hypothetical protein
MPGDQGPQDFFRQSIEHGEVARVEHADQGMHTSAEIEGDDVSYTMAGRPPRGEQGNNLVAEMISAASSKQFGGDWKAHPTAPEGPERGVDWYIEQAGEEAVGVQVTRAGPSQRWAESQGNGTDGVLRIDDVAAEIADAIEKKLNAQDPLVILALSIGQPGVHAFQDVVQAFRATYLPMLRPRIRFAQIWLVGYSLETTHRLWPI